MAHDKIFKNSLIQRDGVPTRLGLQTNEEIWKASQLQNLAGAFVRVARLIDLVVWLRIF